MEPQPNTMLLIYDPQTGRGSYSIEWPWPDGSIDLLDSQDLTWIVAPRAMTNRVWVDVHANPPSVQTREEGPWEHTSLTPSTSETFVISNLPPGSLITVGNEAYTIDDGEFEFSSDGPGLFKILIESWPYLEEMYEVTFES